MTRSRIAALALFLLLVLVALPSVAQENEGVLSVQTTANGQLAVSLVFVYQAGAQDVIVKMAPGSKPAFSPSMRHVPAGTVDIAAYPPEEESKKVWVRGVPVEANKTTLVKIDLVTGQSEVQAP